MKGITERFYKKADYLYNLDIDKGFLNRTGNIEGKTDRLNYIKTRGPMDEIHIRGGLPSPCCRHQLPSGT